MVPQAGWHATVSRLVVQFSVVPTDLPLLILASTAFSLLRGIQMLAQQTLLVAIVMGSSVTYSELAFRRSSSIDNCGVGSSRLIRSDWLQAAEKSPAFNILSVPATADLPESSHPLKQFLVHGDTAHSHCTIQSLMDG